MLASYLVGATTPGMWSEAMRAAPLPSLLLPDAIDAATASELRARVEAAELTPYTLADRGRYQYCDTLRVDPLWDELAHFAAGIAGAPITLARARWLRQQRGDYSLVKDDARARPPGRVIELVLDLSAGHSGEAEVVYMDGAVAVPLPQVSGALAVVDRSPTSTRFLRPPTIRSVGGFAIVRLLMTFALAN